MKDAAAHSCGCQNKSNKERIMNKRELTAFLEMATEEQIAALTANLPAAGAEGGATKPAAPVVAAAAPVAQVETKTPATAEEFLATVPAGELRDSMAEGLRIGREKKAATIKTLKATGRCKFTDEQLQAKTQEDLDTLVALSGAPVAKIDFGGQGAPRVAEGSEQTVAAPPDMGERIRAAGKK
jgi:hypothetical protein